MAARTAIEVPIGGRHPPRRQRDPPGVRRVPRAPTRRLLAAFGFVCAVGVALAGCANTPQAAVAGPPAPASSRATAAGVQAIGVLREGWHTGFVLPAAEVTPALSRVREWFPGARFLAFGWGDRAFYTAAHRRLATGLAALLPSPSAMFIRGLPAAPLRALPQDSEVRWVRATPREVRRLDAYLHRYLQQAADGQLVSIEPGSFPDSRFFASTGTYDAFHTCNTWTVAGLAYAGLPVSAAGVVFSAQVAHRIAALPTCRHAPGQAATHSETSAAGSPLSRGRVAERVMRPPRGAPSDALVGSGRPVNPRAPGSVGQRRI